MIYNNFIALILLSFLVIYLIGLAINGIYSLFKYVR